MLLNVSLNHVSNIVIFHRELQAFYDVSVQQLLTLKRTLLNMTLTYERKKKETMMDQVCLGQPLKSHVRETVESMFLLSSLSVNVLI